MLRGRETLDDVIYMWNLKAAEVREIDWWLPGVGSGGGDGEILIKENKLPDTR